MKLLRKKTPFLLCFLSLPACLLMEDPKRSQCGFNLASSTTRAGKENQLIRFLFLHPIIEVQKDIGDIITTLQSWEPKPSKVLSRGKLPPSSPLTLIYFNIFLIYFQSRSSTRGSPCSTQRTAASKVTRGALISSRSSQQD